MDFIRIVPDTSSVMLGYCLSGYVEVTVNNPKGLSVQKLDIRLIGAESTFIKWLKFVYPGGITMVLNSGSFAQIDSRSLDFFVANVINTPKIISPGVHRFQFKATLSPEVHPSYNIPAASGFFQGHGSLSYNLVANMNPKVKYGPECIESPVTIIGEHFAPRMSLNLSLDRPIKRFCCLDGGSISLFAKLDKDFYPTGDMMKIYLKIDATNSKVDVSKVQIALLMDVAMAFFQQTGEGSKVVSSIDVAGVNSHTLDEKLVEFLVPVDTIQSLHSDMTEISYHVIITLFAGSNKISGKIPIVICSPERPKITSPSVNTDEKE